MLFKRLRSKRQYAQDIAEAYPKSAGWSDKIVEVANNIRTNPYWLANLINFETAGTWSPSIKNSYGYVGLIQFGTGAIADLNKAHGTALTKPILQAMTAREQMDWVEKYFELPHKRNGFEYSHPMDLYMAVFYPAAMGKPNFQLPASVVGANNQIRTPMDYARRANRNAKLPTGMNGDYKPNNTAITQNGQTSVALVPNWVWYVSIPLLLGSGFLFLKQRKKK